MKEVTPYQLATLASRIDPERCLKEPNLLLRTVVKILRQAEFELRCAAEEDKGDDEWLEGYEEFMERTRVDWAKGTKEITGEQRRERAVRKVTEFVKHQAPGNLSRYKRDGFTLAEIGKFQGKFAESKKQRKGKQGRRISDGDGRLRTELVGLVPRKPRKPA